MNYAVLLICRNEEKNIANCIKGVLNQTIEPSIFVIVDDDSQDETYKIITEYASKYEIIKPMCISNIRYKIKGINISYAIRKGIDKLFEIDKDSDYILKLDADAFIPRHYVETIMKYMENDELLGISGGVSNIPGVSKQHVADAAKIYRKNCLVELLPYPVMHGHDSFTQWWALYRGWKVRNVKVRYTDSRPYRRGNYRCFLEGKFRYQNGFDLTICAYRLIGDLFNPPYIIGSIIAFLSYLSSFLVDKRVYKHGYYVFMKKYLRKELLINLRSRAVVLKNIVKR